MLSQEYDVIMNTYIMYVLIFKLKHEIMCDGLYIMNHRDKLRNKLMLL